MRLPVVLLTAVLLAGAPAAALAQSAPADPADPCAPVDGVPPPMCQSGVPADGAALPRTGRDDLPALAAGGTSALVAGAWLVAVARRRVVTA